MRVLLTGGAGDLATVLSARLEARGDIPVRLDIVAPRDTRGVYVAGSLLDRACVRRTVDGIDCVVHIGAWHGIHESTQQKDAYDFWDLNVTGTFHVFEAAARAGVRHVVYISSTSIRDRTSLYGHSKVLGEELACTYAARHGLHVVVLRPRGFIPSWNTVVYHSFVEWAQWFWRGAVHIEDVGQAVMQSIALTQTMSMAEALILVVDGAYEYTAEDLATWDHTGPGSTFRKYYAPYETLARQHGLLPEVQPYKYDISETQRCLGYDPTYSLRNLLVELEAYGAEGPPPPYV